MHMVDMDRIRKERVNLFLLRASAVVVLLRAGPVASPWPKARLDEK